MDIQQEINKVLKSGNRETENFNGCFVLKVESKITVSQSLAFSSFLSKISKNKGRNNGTINDKTLSIISDWYDVNGGSIIISHIYGKSIKNNTDYHTISWNKEVVVDLCPKCKKGDFITEGKVHYCNKCNYMQGENNNL